VRSPTSGTGSTTSSADASHSGGYAQSAPLSPVYDPVTGIVYYPHVPPGTLLPAGAVQGAVPGHLLPLPAGSGHQCSPSFPDGRLPTPSYFSDDGSLADARLEDSRNLSRSGSGMGQFEIGAPPAGGNSAPGSNTNTPRVTTKKERNRGSYRCGRCGKPKVPSLV
jgi:hypothetical protein